MKKINRILIEIVEKEAITSKRKRKNFNFHEFADDKLQRILHVIEPESYVQPHKHENPDKREAFILIRGKAVIIEFDDSGKITDHIILDHNLENYGVDIPPKVFHTIIALEKTTVVYEAKDGPYNPDTDKNFAEWAPVEGDPKAAEYKENLLKKISII